MAGLYTLANNLAAQIQTQLQTVNGSMACTESSGVFTISGTANFVLTWTHPGVRDWLGFTGTLTGTNTYTALVTSPGTFVASLPWAEEDPRGVTWQLKRWEGHHLTGRALKQARFETWRTRAMVTNAEFAQFRGVMRYLLRGMAATWFRDTTNGSVWSFTNWDGFLLVTLDQGSYTDDFPDRSVIGEMFSDLQFLAA